TTHERREHHARGGHGMPHRQTQETRPGRLVNDGGSSGAPESDVERPPPRPRHHASRQYLPIMWICCSSLTALESMRSKRLSAVSERAATYALIARSKSNSIIDADAMPSCGRGHFGAAAAAKSKKRRAIAGSRSSNARSPAAQ